MTGRTAHHALVEHDRHEILDVRRRLGAEAAGALVVHRELDEVPSVGDVFGLRVGEVLAGDDRLRVEHIERAIDSIAERHRSRCSSEAPCPAASAACTSGSRQIAASASATSVCGDVDTRPGICALLEQLREARPPASRARSGTVLLACCRAFFAGVGREQRLQCRRQCR